MNVTRFSDRSNRTIVPMVQTCAAPIESRGTATPTSERKL